MNAERLNVWQRKLGRKEETNKAQVDRGESDRLRCEERPCTVLLNETDIRREAA